MFGDKKNSWLGRLTSPQYIILHYSALYYTTLNYTTKYYTSLHFTSLHFTSLHYSTLTTLYWSSQKELIEVLDKIWLEVGDKEESQD